jgi:uncharacterized repeat protein (TIGR01451 family)
VAAGAVVAPLVAGSGAAYATVPGKPGVPQPPTPLYTEDFSHQDATSAGISLPNYTGAPGTVYVPGVSGASSQTYYADPNWDGKDCDGWILNGSSPLPPASSNCTTADWSALKTLVGALGTFQGMTTSAASANQALSEYTDGNPGAGVEFQTNAPIPALAGHFYQVTAIFGEENCPNGATKASLTFSLIVNGTLQTVGSNLVPCTDPGAQAIGSVKVALLRSSTLQVTGASPTLGLQLYNAQGSGGGNDVAFDLPQILDVTPQLDKSFTPSTISSGGTSTLTFVITNTNELAAKNGWSFTDDLPAGVTATGANSTTCPSGAVTAGAGAGSVSVSGNLSQGMTSCSVTVEVTASAPGTYGNGPGNFPPGTAGLNGLNPPGTSALTVTPPASLVIAKQSSTTALTAAGQVVTYKFLATNRGRVTLDNLQITDTQEPPAAQGNMSAITCAVTTLAPGDSTTCYGTYRVTQADVDHGSLQDTATASGTDPQGATVTSPPSILTVRLPTPGISVVKSSATTEATAAGQHVPYSFVVTNTGNVTLTGITVTDMMQPPASPANMSAVTCPQPDLAAGASQTCTGTYTVTQADLNNGSIGDSATASGTGPDGNIVTSPLSPLAIPAQPPGALSIAKATTTAAVTGVGQQVPFTFRVTNNSTATVSAITVTDTVTPPSLPGNLSAVTCPGTSLAAGASMTCTATYQVTQADLNAGQVSDTAHADGTDPAGNPVHSGSSSVTLDVPTATLSIVKATSVASERAAGQQIPYTFTVTNTGNQPVTGVSVTDTQVPPASPGNMSAISCPQPNLPPGQSETCTGTYMVSQADLDNGSVNDYAVASGAGPSGPVTSPQSSTSVAVPPPALSMVKSSPDDTYNSSGQAVKYAFTVTNNSVVTYTGIQIQDTPQPPATPGNLSPVSCPQPDLPAGASETCTATYTVTVADIDHGTLADSATATGTDPAGDTFTTPVSSVILPAAQAPAISMVKSASPAQAHKAGDVITYSFLVTNTGNDTLNDITVSDAQVVAAKPPNGPVTCPGTTLAPGASVTCTATYTVTQADVDNGTVTDSATASGTPPSGPAVTSPPSAASVSIPPAPALTVAKSSTTASVTHAGQRVPYSFLVTNAGNVTLAGIAVADTVAPPSDPAGLSPVTCPVATLAPGASTTCTATYTVTQADVDNGSVDDSATVTGTPPSGPAVASAPSAASVPVVQGPALTVIKSTTTASVIGAGQQVPYSFLVTDTGNVTISNVTVTDTVAPPSDPANLSAVTCPVTTLAPGASVTCAATYTVTQADMDHGSLADAATVTGTPPATPANPTPPPLPASPPSRADVPVAQSPALTVIKSAPSADVHAAGDVIGYAFEVTNTGNVTLKNVTVTDALDLPAGSVDGPVTCPDTTLATGASETCTASYTLTQADVDHGSVSDTATASGTSPSGPGVTSPPSAASVPVPAGPAVNIVKSATPAGAHKPGDQVTYRYTVTDTGNDTLTNVTVNDTMTAPASQANLSPVSCPGTTLAPGTSMTCTATYTVTQADVDNGSLADSAAATATPPAGPAVGSPQAAVLVPIPGTPALTVAKRAGPATVSRAGQVISYSFDVTNTGNVTLRDVTVADTVTPPSDPANLSPVTCPGTPLAPGASVTCTAAYTVTQADVDHGKAGDSATATGTPPATAADPSPSPLPPSAPSDSSVPVAQHPAIAIVKEVASPATAPPGGLIHFRFTVSNEGNVTLTQVKVSDPLLAAEGITVRCPQPRLAPGESESCVPSAPYVVPSAATVALTSGAGGVTLTAFVVPGLRAGRRSRHGARLLAAAGARRAVVRHAVRGVHGDQRAGDRRHGGQHRHRVCPDAVRAAHPLPAEHGHGPGHPRHRDPDRGRRQHADGRIQPGAGRRRRRGPRRRRRAAYPPQADPPTVAGKR